MTHMAQTQDGALAGSPSSPLFQELTPSHLPLERSVCWALTWLLLESEP